MKYKILKLERVLENGEATKQLLTLEATYDNDSTSTHGKYIPLDSDPKEESILFAAELEVVLEEPKEICIEEVEVASKDKEVKQTDISSKMAELAST